MAARDASVRLFLCGDVMTGRGIDQVLQHPSDPRLHEPFVKSARRYVEIAEDVNGPIPRHVPPAYVWGDALEELDRARPDARIVNLETSVTTAGEFWVGKGIHYRMHPANAACLAAAGIDCCTLANNHVLDWGRGGLCETLATLRAAGIRTAGAGESLAAALAPAVLQPRAGVRVLVFAYGSPTAGVPGDWAATATSSGVSWLDESEPSSVARVGRAVREARRPGDVVVVSLHWGSNWGYHVTGDQARLARGLIDAAEVDVVHGHSSHHPRPIEVHDGKLILYGCGDFLNDYEGIADYEVYRPELALMYLPDIDIGSGRLRSLRLVPVRLHRFRLQQASDEEAGWLAQRMDVECRAFGSGFRRLPGGHLELTWH